MKILFVFAHPEQQSFNGALKDTAISTLTEEGHEVLVSDLYQLNWSIQLSRENFTELKDPNYFNAEKEQNDLKFQKTILKEMEKVKEAELIIFQFPFWWFSMPGILKSWIDIVFASNFAYGGKKGYFENAGLVGKKALISITTGAPKNFFTEKGRNGNILLSLYPILFGIFNFTGMDSYLPSIWYGPGLLDDEGRKEYLTLWGERLKNLKSEKFIDFQKSSSYLGNDLQLKEGLKTNFEILGQY
ncbi:nad p h oxidoreductase-related [Anaeramoeba flamelloides]|uniref:Nad p h oxidoreductase-related n=1 Tax=Anaeramoeba flamelloides TaxID=1746091 RepID=A0ABQ8ZDB0_9EUKA|nr:nad p h oxidoreductase-related [Anaeramoeba flamelloides]